MSTTAPQARAGLAVVSKARRRREMVLARFEHLWRLRPSYFWNVKPTATQFVSSHVSGERLWFGSNMEGWEICR